MNRIPLDIDCREIADEVKHLRDCGKWQSRSYDFPFYTLGVSAYLDGNTEKYYSRANTTLGMGDKDTHAFTVAIELPTGGGGMDMKIGGESNEYIEYQVGELVLHDGMTPHRIASYCEYKPDEFRITLQGHIVRDGTDLIMFW